MPEHKHDCHCHEEGCACGHRRDKTGNPDHQQNPGCHVATPSFKRQDPDKGVSLGEEAEHEIAAAMKKRYARFLEGDEHFIVKTEVCHHFGLVSSQLTNSQNTTDVRVEVSVECEPNHIENPMDAYTEAIDVLDLVWLDYFDSNRISHYLPIWQSYEIDSHSVNVRLEHSNPALDDEGSAFLKAHGFLDNGLSPADYEE